MASNSSQITQTSTQVIDGFPQITDEQHDTYGSMLHYAFRNKVPVYVRALEDGVVCEYGGELQGYKLGPGNRIEVAFTRFRNIITVVEVSLDEFDESSDDESA